MAKILGLWKYSFNPVYRQVDAKKQRKVAKNAESNPRMT